MFEQRMRTLDHIKWYGVKTIKVIGYGYAFGVAPALLLVWLDKLLGG